MAARKAFPLRISPELYDELRRWAEADLRSVNGQIEFLLRRAVKDHGRGGAADKRSRDVGPGSDDD